LRNAPALPLIEVLMVDSLSGMGVGVAFGQGGESARMYDQARAVAALPKSILGELLGLEIDDADWPYALLPRTEQTDRGAGAAQKIGEIRRGLGMSADLSPAYTPQSNSPVEQQHTRAVSAGGAPTYIVSKLTAVSMARQSVMRIMGENRSKNISGRLTPETAGLGIQTPLELWKHFGSIGRIQGIPMKQEDVITKFVPKVQFKIREGRLTRFGLAYRSEAFSTTQYSKQIRSHEGEVLVGHAFDISNRIEWVIVEGKLIKVSPIPNVPEHLDEICMTNLEMPLFERQLLDNGAAAPSLRRGEGVRLLVDSVELTGQAYQDGTMRKGRAKARTPASKAEAAASRAS